jgi:hypothetical protein
MIDQACDFAAIVLDALLKPESIQISMVMTAPERTLKKKP